MTNERRLPDGRVELIDTTRIEASAFYNHDLAPVPLRQRNVDDMPSTPRCGSEGESRDPESAWLAHPSVLGLFKSPEDDYEPSSRVSAF
jgi:hypothetical protein